jgi:hypothetical protein
LSAKPVYCCQLGVFRVLENARDFQSKITRDLPQALRTEQLKLIQRPDPKGKGTFHVLIVDDLANEEAAEATCNSFGSKGHDCFVLKR